ncbi:MAG: radical SAM protein [Candidatus Omnitrophota bacterium]|jgi:DNA repair photolyase
MNIKLINTQKALSPTQITLADYCINPYRGCEFGCLYCYSLENKNIKNAGSFGGIGVKVNIEEVLRRELKYTNPKRVLLGSTTECFQYAELKYRLSEKVLNTLNEFNIPYTILTKSHLIKEYLSLIAKNKQNKIYFTLNCEQVKLLERKSPTQAQQLEAIKQIIKNNIALRIHIGPFIPYISILKGLLEIIPSGVKEVDIELYHHKMGNFEEILKIMQNNLGMELKNKLSSVYETEASYLAFAKSLKADITALGGNFKDISFFYIIPDFNMFYNKGINYHDKLES